jgi:hypothetical protein
VGRPIIKALKGMKAIKGMKLMIKMDCVHLLGMLVIGLFWRNMIFDIVFA